MEKKSILFAVSYMNLGGVEKSLLSLINVLPADEFDIHLALMNDSGCLFSSIPPHVTIHFIEPYRKAADFLDHPVKETLSRIKAAHSLKPLKDFAQYASAKLRGTLHPLYAYILRGDKSLADTEFDLAVNYSGPSEMLDYYIAHHIRARHKALWIHFDLNHVFDRKKSSMLSHGAYDRIFCVSADALRVYKKRYPRFARKAEFFPNLIDSKEVLALADAKDVFSPIRDAINIVTVGRLEAIKGQDIALRALALLPPHYHWHFVGAPVGDRLEKLLELAKKLDVDSRCHFHGSQANPYPFMKQADVYVQPSRSEGSPLTIAEIKLFDKPIVTTPFVSAPQLLADCANRAIIASTFEPSALACAIIDAMQLTSSKHSGNDTFSSNHNPVDTLRNLTK